MKNLTLKYEKLPHEFVAFYTKIEDKDYIIINSLHTTDKTFLAVTACLYFKENNIENCKILLEDLSKDDYEPIKYAKSKLNYIKEGIECDKSRTMAS